MIPRNEIGVVTVWQPMAWCIEIGIKKIENRTIEPWKSIKYIAIHAGLKWHEEHARQLREHMALEIHRDDPRIKHGVILAIAEYAGSIYDSESPWFSGPVGWRLDDARVLEPIVATGKQGIWRLSEAEYFQLHTQLLAGNDAWAQKCRDP